MISIIAAVAANGVIGSGNRMPWHIREDLKRFRQLTTGHPVVMGRRTWESLGKPLPGRKNVVITRRGDYTAQGAVVTGSLEQAAALFTPAEEVFIIGGGEIYRQAIGMADKLYITHLMEAYEGDTLFPDIDPSLWRPVFTERHASGENYPHPFVYVDYERIG